MGDGPGVETLSPTLPMPGGPQANRLDERFLDALKGQSMWAGDSSPHGRKTEEVARLGEGQDHPPQAGGVQGWTRLPVDRVP